MDDSGAQSERRRYHAFISYSRAVDGSLAPALRNALHQFARPWNRLRALNVFQDDANLTASPELWNSVVRALDQAEHFVLLASPEAASSPWVRRELEHWLKNRDVREILIVHTAGEIRWDDAAQDFDWGESSALPDILRGRFPAEPRHVDLRWVRSTTDLSLRNVRFRAAVADLAAPMHGRSKDEIIGRDVEEQRRREAIRRRVVIALTISVIAAVGSAVFAAHQRGVAEQERDDARRQRDIALSRQLAAEAAHFSETGRDVTVTERAAAFAVESWRIRRNPVAAEAAARLAWMLPTRRVATGDEGWSAALAGNGRFLATEGGGIGRILEAATGAELARVQLGGDGGLFCSVAISDSGSAASFVGPGGRVFLVRIDGRSAVVSALAPADSDGPRRAVTSMAMSADGRSLALGQVDGTVRVIDVATGKERKRFAFSGVAVALALSSDGRMLAHGSRPQSQAARLRVVDTRDGRALADLEVEGGLGIEDWSFSPDGFRLAAALRGKKALLLDTASGTLVAEYEYGDVPQVVAFSRDSRRLAVGGEMGVVHLVDTAAGMESGRIPHDGAVFSLAFSHTGELLAMGDDNGTARLVEVAGLRLIARAPREITVTAVAFSADDRELITRDFDGNLWVASAVDCRRAVRVRHADEVNVLKISPDGRWLATGGRDGDARLFEIPGGRLVARIRHAIDRATQYRWRGVGELAFSSDGRYLATGGSDRAATIVESETGSVVARIQLSGSGELGAGCPLDISPDGTVIVVADSQLAGPSALRFIEIPSSKERFRVELEDAARHVEFSPDSRVVAAMSGMGSVQLVKAADGTELVRLSVETTRYGLAEFSPDSRYLALGGNPVAARGELRVVATADGRTVLRVDHRKSVNMLAFDQASRRLAVAMDEGHVRVVAIESGDELLRVAHADRVRAVEFSADGYLLASASSDGVVIVTTLATGEQRSRHLHGSGVSTIQFSPDGGVLATGSWDGTARLIEISSMTEIARFAHGDHVHTVAFTPDGRLLATASRAGTAELNWVDPQRVFDSLLECSGRNLSRAEWHEAFGADIPWRPTCAGWSTTEDEQGRD